MRRCFPLFVQANKPLPSGMDSFWMSALADIKQFEEGMKTMFEEASGDGPKESSSRKACKTGREHHDLRNNQLTKFQ